MASALKSQRILRCNILSTAAVFLSRVHLVRNEANENTLDYRKKSSAPVLPWKRGCLGDCYPSDTGATRLAVIEETKGANRFSKWSRYGSYQIILIEFEWDMKAQQRQIWINVSLTSKVGVVNQWGSIMGNPSTIWSQFLFHLDN